MSAVERTTVAIIGTGFGGLAAAIELKRHGHQDFIIFERGSTVGGVWRENTYPGAACDVPSPYYSFSFAPNPAWPNRYSGQPAILSYLQDTAEKFGLLKHIRFNTEVTAAQFNEAANTWTVHTSPTAQTSPTVQAGSTSQAGSTAQTSPGDTVEAAVLISAVGQLSRPAFPAIPGRDSFAGVSFHSAQWDHGAELAGKRVAVIGTGASAIQFVPEIATEVSTLSLFQRSAPYLLARFDTALSERHHKLLGKVPLIQKGERVAWYAVTELVATAFLYSKPLSKTIKALSRWHMKRLIGNDGVLAKVWPDYELGCKRVLFANDYLPTLNRPNVDVVTTSITGIEQTGIRTSDGVLHEVDAIIYGTGFTANDFLAPMDIRGQGGRLLREEWSAGAHAYLGMSTPNFPNLFLMYGPNTNLGSGSIVFMLESQARYIRQALDWLSAGMPDGGTPDGGPARPGATSDSATLDSATHSGGVSGLGAMAVRTEVEADYDRELQARLVDGVWSQCASWYRAANGRVATNWPGTQREYRRRTEKFDATKFVRVQARVDAP